MGQKISNERLIEQKRQLEDFRTHLEEFALKHKKEINDNPVFRKEFLQMCREIGVDPLSSTQKTGFMSKLFDSQTTDFYYELAIQITNICIALRPKNGGFLEESECLRLLNRLRGAQSQRVEIEDIGKALKSLEKLSNDFKIVETGNKRMIISSSVDINSDQMTLLGIAEKNGGWISYSKSTFSNQERFETAVEQLLMEGMAWEDEQPLLDENSKQGVYANGTGVVYWIPTLMKNQERYDENI